MNQNKKREENCSMNIPMITGHSGCEGTAIDSEDSVLKAVDICRREEKAGRAGTVGVEVDVRRSRSGIMYISHDCQDQDAEKKLSLSQVFGLLLPTTLKVNCDLKDNYAVYYAIDLARQAGLPRERLIFSGSASVEQLMRQPWITEESQIYLNIEEVLLYLYLLEHTIAADTDIFQLSTDPWHYLKEHQVFGLENGILSPEIFRQVITLAKRLHVSCLNMPYQLLSEESASQLKQAQLPCSVWTVNEEKDVEKCFRLGASNITTLKPSLALCVRQRLFEQMSA